MPQPSAPVVLIDPLFVIAFELPFEKMPQPFTPAVLIDPVFVIAFELPAAEMPRPFSLAVLIDPLFVIAFELPATEMPRPPCPAVLIDPVFVIVLELPVPEMPKILGPVTVTLPEGPIVSVSPPFNSGVVGPCVVVLAVLIVVSAASANCGVEIINAHRVADLTALLVTFFRLAGPPWSRKI